MKFIIQIFIHFYCYWFYCTVNAGTYHKLKHEMLVLVLADDNFLGVVKYDSTPFVFAPC